MPKVAFQGSSQAEAPAQDEADATPDTNQSQAEPVALAADVGDGLCGLAGSGFALVPVTAQGTTITWSKKSGPGSCTFDPADAAMTTVTCDKAGEYELVLTVSDGMGGEASDASIFKVSASGSGAVNACLGKRESPIGELADSPTAVAIQADGKIVIAGTADNGMNLDVALTRYNPDGSQDKTFGKDGKVITDVSGRDEAEALKIQADGKIVVVGTSGNDTATTMTVLRYEANGSLDTTFNMTGKLQIAIAGNFERARNVIIQSDGKIVVGGISFVGSSYDFTLVRLNTDGALDTGFSGDGIASLDFVGGEDGILGLALQADGKIVAAGYAYGATNNSSDFGVARFNANGTLDTTFSVDGKDRLSFAGGFDSGRSVEVLSDGKILIAGVAQIDGLFQAGMVRYATDGEMDRTFGGNGRATVQVASNTEGYGSFMVLPDGRVVLAGFRENGVSREFAVARLSATGVIDTTFGANGRTYFDFGDQSDSATAVAVEKSGNLIVAGPTKNTPDFGWIRLFK